MGLKNHAFSVVGLCLSTRLLSLWARRSLLYPPFCRRQPCPNTRSKNTSCASISSEIELRFVPEKPIWRRFDVSIAAETEEDKSVQDSENSDIFHIPRSSLPPRVQLDLNTIKLLERLSLTDFGTEKCLDILEEAIRYADPLLTDIAFQGTTRNERLSRATVAPLYSIVEAMDPNYSCPLDDDIPIVDPSLAECIVNGAPVIWEGYFVSPPGNVPIEPKGIERRKSGSGNTTCS
ncbi:hypothetical protein CRM22_008977 [Opisthorchis felineus]|uniref:Glutamyl-tRNA(Gln) amidotransferase subunit C, mitochondrial n=1 Tax=Opisthorchis felineus TaxID=147828 RepID=A0A4S2L9H1_OPIFE|nr:hypothetical protein CRM22_008977 [Opisthorchis felineus]